MTKNNHAKTIQIFLPSGDPTGIRIAEQTTSIMRVIEVPRRDFADFLEMEESHQVALYFLVCGDEKDQVYIGQSSSVGERIKQHIQKDKIDWERALILVSLTHNLTKTHVLYLESLAIETAKTCKRIQLLNSDSGQKTHTPTPLKADCDQIHDISNLLLATLGYPFFEPLVKISSNPTANENTIFICPRSGNIDARAIYTNEGMVVLKDSRFPYIQKAKATSYRHKMIERCDHFLTKGILRKEGSYCVFNQDYLFNSPSTAASLLVLGNANGWTEFKTPNGITLKEYHAQFLQDKQS